jgi:hypothetical protein
MTVAMRADLVEEGYTVPAGLGFSDYDNLHDDFYLSAKELEGAEEFDNGVDPDAHPFIVVKLKDGRVVYMIGADLDWLN